MCRNNGVGSASARARHQSRQFAMAVREPAVPMIVETKLMRPTPSVETAAGLVYLAAGCFLDRSWTGDRPTEARRTEAIGTARRLLMT